MFELSPEHWAVVQESISPTTNLVAILCRVFINGDHENVTATVTARIPLVPLDHRQSGLQPTQPSVLFPSPSPYPYILTPPPNPQQLPPPRPPLLLCINAIPALPRSSHPPATLRAPHAEPTVREGLGLGFDGGPVFDGRGEER